MRKALPPGDAIKSYRYLRMGIVGSVVMLAASILLEHDDVRDRVADCWQTSISAYYYTPARAVFVGAMFSVGFALIVIKGRGLEDVCLNLAGLLAPVVAIAPTTNVVIQGPGCWSLEPDARPVIAREDGTTELAPWVLRIVENNFEAFLIAAALGLVTGCVIAYLDRTEDPPRDTETRYRLVSFVASATLLILGLALYLRWEDFFSRAHGFAALFMFAFLFGAVVTNIDKARSTTRYRIAYAIVAASMALGAAVIWLTPIFGEHKVFALEAWEITMFAVYWILQTVDNWNERVGLGV